MPRALAVLALVLLLLSNLSSAQGDVTGRLVEVRVEGSTTYADIVRTIITSRVGTAAANIDLEAERNRIYSLGTFDSVTIEIETSAAGPALVIRLRENPRIGEIEFEGVASVNVQALAATLASAHLLEAGRVYNTVRASEAAATIRQAYRQAGFPFDVGVDLEVQRAPDLAESQANVPVRLIYTIDEAARVSRLIFLGNTVMTSSELEEYFGGLVDEGVFNPQVFNTAVDSVRLAYIERGYRGSGVNPATTTLGGGVLTVQLRELTIASIDTTALGVDPGSLNIQPGDLFNFDLLLADVKRLARGRSSDVQLGAELTASGGVRVTFRLGAPETAGPVREVLFEGNTVVSDETLRAAMNLQVGDTFTSAVAQEDFGMIVRAYQQAGYRIVTTPDFSFDDGSYIQRVTELKLRDYQVNYDGEQGATQEHVVLRYLPDPGTVVNDQRIVAGLLQVARLGVLDVINYGLEPTDVRDEVRVIVTVRKRSTGQLRPTASYATDTGFSANLSYNESNFLGLAHSASAEVTLSNTDVGLMLGGRLSYDIPWLYIDALDFQEVPTSVSASLFSVNTSNQPLTANGQVRALYPGLADVEENYVLVGEYTTRATGFGFTLGRPIAPNTSISLGANGVFNDNKLEPPKGPCPVEDGVITDPNACTLPYDLAIDHLPTSGLSAFASARVNFDNRDDPNFPTTGIAGYGSLGVGFGNDFLDPVTAARRGYIYEQVTLGARTYLKLSDMVPEVRNENHVFAVRLDVGHQFGGLYPVSRRFLVGRTNDINAQVRGYVREDFNLSRSYATASFEYRYDFQLTTVATQTVIGIVFVDVGWASSVPGFGEYQTPVFAGVGVGVQVNIAIGGLTLPPVRLDYAFSQRHRWGVFGIHIGPVF